MVELCIYTYTPEELGLSSFSPGPLRLESTPDIQVTHTRVPDLAHVFIVPEPVYKFEPEHLHRVPYIKSRPTRHVFWNISDFVKLYPYDCMFISPGLTTLIRDGKDRRAHEPHGVPWPWGVDDFKEFAGVEPGGFRYDVSFQGWVWSTPRRKSVASIIVAEDINFDCSTYRDFCGYIYDQPEGLRRRAEFRRSMHESKFALAPESIPGVLPYRFYEAMSCARVPIVVGRNYILPFTREIPYADFCMFCDIGDTHMLPDMIREYMATKGDPEGIIERGKLARAYWEKWLNRENWSQMLTYTVAQQIGLIP